MTQDRLPFFTHPPSGGANGVRGGEAGVAVEDPRPVQAQVDTQPGDGVMVHGDVGARGKRHEKMLTVRLGAQEHHLGLA